MRHEHLLALLRVLLQDRLDLLAVSKVLVEFLAELREHGLLLLRERAARRIAADQRIAVHGLELEEQVELKPLDAVRIGCRVGR
eukprot:scaffold142762_cov244-Phaeocystis_antarctica.AAC.1